MILVHELGHVFFVKLFRYQLYSLVVHCLGGFCEHEEVSYDREEVWVSLGGILAELFILVLALAVFGLLVCLRREPDPLLTFILIHNLVFVNLFMIGFNLLPLRGFDGYLVLNYFRNGGGFSSSAYTVSQAKVRSLSDRQLKKIAKQLIHDSMKAARKAAGKVARKESERNIFE